MRAHAASAGWVVAGEHADRELSGGGDGTELDPAQELAQRAGLWKAIEQLAEGDILAVYRRDRLARSVYASEYLRRLVESKGARIESLQGLNGDTPEERLVQQVLAATDEFAKRVGALRTSDAMRRHQAAGRSMSRFAPYGYRLERCDKTTRRGNRACKLVPVPEEQAIIAKMLAWTRQHYGPTTIARALRCAGHKFRTLPWSPYLVKRVLAREKGKVA